MAAWRFRCAACRAFLIEGDATVAMLIYMAKNPLVALAFTRSLNTGVSTEQFNQAPVLCVIVDFSVPAGKRMGDASL